MRSEARDAAIKGTVPINTVWRVPRARRSGLGGWRRLYYRRPAAGENRGLHPGSGA